jgi:hypothetical protein
MKPSRRNIRWLGAMLALVALVGWIGAASLHQHPGDPGCQVCKLLQHGAADIVDPVRLTAVPCIRPADVPATIEPARAAVPTNPPGRAPPTA